MALKIEQTWARLGLRTRHPFMKLRTKEPRLQIIEPLPRIRLRRSEARIKCDASRCREEIGISTPLSLARKMTLEAWHHSMDYIARKAQEGDIMARIAEYDISSVMKYLGSSTFVEQQFNLARIPKSRVKVEVIPAELETDWQLGRLRLKLQYGDTFASLQRGEVKAYLRSKAGIKIEYSGENLDASG